MKRIGLYGGTFNPVHFGHLNLVIELCEKWQLDEVLWIPALASPFRVDEQGIEGSHRLKMVALAIEGIPGFRVIDNELRRPPPSYTIDTIREVTQQQGEFFLLLGEDSLIKFKEWKEPEEIVKKITLLIGCRRDSLLKEKIHSLGFSPLVSQKIHQGLTETRLMEISATQVRNRLSRKLYCAHLVPSKVLDYIYENQLYFHSK